MAKVILWISTTVIREVFYILSELLSNVSWYFSLKWVHGPGPDPGVTSGNKYGDRNLTKAAEKKKKKKGMEKKLEAKGQKKRESPEVVSEIRPWIQYSFFLIRKYRQSESPKRWWTELKIGFGRCVAAAYVSPARTAVQGGFKRVHVTCCRHTDRHGIYTGQGRCDRTVMSCISWGEKNVVFQLSANITWWRTVHGLPAVWCLSAC